MKPGKRSSTTPNNTTFKQQKLSMSSSSFRGSSESKSESPYEYDLAVVGGGSGGMAAAKEAARHGARVVLFDYVKPSTQGTKWGLGGTCVNVGCVPKKLMHRAAVIGQTLHDAHHYGWSVGEEAQKFDWAQLVTNTKNHIRMLNFGYKKGLKSAQVTYINGLASFPENNDGHTLEYIKRFKEKEPPVTLTFDKVLIAVGGRPTLPSSVPGVSEHAITSDDIFYLNRSPGRTLVVGGGYIALECGGFLKECGFDVDVAVRSILLRGFDRDAVAKIHEHMAGSGTRFLMRANITNIDKDETTGKLRVTMNVDGQDSQIQEYDTVLYATGRTADTANLHLPNIGVHPDQRGKLACTDEQTAVAHVYAVGDVLSGRPELTPVAIQAGEFLARRLYAGAVKKMNYDLVCTTVFTPVEYGTCGLSEEAAIAQYGDSDIETYLWQWKTLEVEAAHRLKHPNVRADEFDDMPMNCMAKLVCIKSMDEKVIGFHFVGPNAGEVTQGFGLALKLGAKKEDFDDLVGIHPTDAEAFCAMDVRRSEVKSPEDWTASGGCGGGKCG